jgi:hypothetical protein
VGWDSDFLEVATGAGPHPRLDKRVEALLDETCRELGIPKDRLYHGDAFAPRKDERVEGKQAFTKDETLGKVVYLRRLKPSDKMLSEQELHRRFGDWWPVFVKDMQGRSKMERFYKVVPRKWSAEFIAIQDRTSNIRATGPYSYNLFDPQTGQYVNRADHNHLLFNA